MRRAFDARSRLVQLGRRASVSTFRKRQDLELLLPCDVSEISHITLLSGHHHDVTMISDSMVESVLHPGEVGATTSMAGGP